jgi:hypothetical protein
LCGYDYMDAAGQYGEEESGERHLERVADGQGTRQTKNKDEANAGTGNHRKQEERRTARRARAFCSSCTVSYHPPELLLLQLSMQQSRHCSTMAFTSILASPHLRKTAFTITGTSQYGQSEAQEDGPVMQA